LSVNEVKQSLGSWSLRLRDSTPKSILDQLAYFGHVAIVPGPVTPEALADGLLTVARYVGVLREREADEQFSIGGPGMAFWLGDEDDKGDVFETAITLVAQTFAASVTALLPPGGSVTAGTINSIAGTYDGVHQWQTPRQAIDYVTQLFNAEWRVTGDGKLDAGTVAQLYRTTPHAILVRKQDGREMDLVSMPGLMSLDSDVEDYTTRVVLLAEGEGSTISTGAADAAVVPYKDIHNNVVKLTRLVSESETTDTNADARAQLQLNRFAAARANVSLSTGFYDVKGDLSVGDYLAIYDPNSGFVDAANELYWRGQPINPIFLRCIAMSYPIPSGWTVAYRDLNGVWVDLSPYYIPEGGDTTITVGEFSRNLSGIGGEPISIRVNAPDAGAIPPDTTIPAVVVFGAYSTAAYQSGRINDLRAAVQLTWSQPLNTDASTIIDGDHYEIQYRVTQAYSYPITWNQMSLFRWNQIQTWGRPLSNDANTGDNWNTIVIPFDQTVALIQELSVAVEYEFRIRAVDTASPPNVGAWSTTLTLTTTGDVIAPSVPAAPTVAASQLAIQVVSFLGKSSGGTFNLESDLNHLEVHVGGPNLFPDSTTLVGRIPANESNLIGRIPVVATFALPNTTDVWVKIVAVDRYGNRSGGSSAVQSSILLIDTSRISDLSVSKVTAGTISADWLVAAAIKTSLIGRRIELNSFGLQAFDAAGNLTANLSADPSVTGNFISFGDGTKQLASIDETGVITGQDVYGNRVFVGGVNIMDDVIIRRPKGVMAYSKDLTDVAGIGPGSPKGYLEMSFVAEANRMYKITCIADMESTSAAVNERYTYKILDGGASQPVLASTNLITETFPAIQSVGTNTTVHFSFFSTFTPGLHRLLWTFHASVGTGTIRGADGPSFFLIEDMGPADLFINAGVINDGSGTVVNPITGNTLTYLPTWCQTYQGDNSIGINGPNEDLWQGDDGGGYGNGRALVGFDSGQIQADLVGKTILSCTVTLEFWRWRNSSGGTAIVGTHASTTRPSTWVDADVFQDRVESTSWPSGGRRSVDLGTTIGGEFKSGASTGIAIGPGPSAGNVYSGTAYGLTSSSRRPKLQFVIS
jgi:hypothetical protein